MELNEANAEVIRNATRAKATLDSSSAASREDLRKSVQTVISQRQSLSESQVLNTIADVIMGEINAGNDPGESMSGSFRGLT